MVNILASGPSCPGFTSQRSPKIVDATEVNQLACFEKSGEWLENVDWSHLLLISGKLVLKKTPYNKYLRMIILIFIEVVNKLYLKAFPIGELDCFLWGTSELLRQIVLRQLVLKAAGTAVSLMGHCCLAVVTLPRRWSPLELAFQCDDYLKVVKNPMDFDKMLSKLDGKEYNSAQGFLVSRF